MSKAEIVVLSQEDEIKAGLLDMKMVMDAVEKAYKMLGEGQIINPAKIKLGLPDDQDWMTYFMSMPSYIGGDINTAGFKWAAESKYNVTESTELPLGVDVIVLSDPHTVMPKAFMDGTIITAMRTSAVAGVAAKYLADKNAKTACLVGAGVIGRTMIMAMMEALPKLEQVHLVDLDLKKAEALAKEFEGKCDVTAYSSIQEGAADADVVVTETTAGKPIVKLEWIKKNATVIQMSGYELEDEIALKADKLIVDYWLQIAHFKHSLIHHLCEENGLKKEDVTEISQLTTGEKPGRETEDELIVCATMGVGMLDIMVAKMIYDNALNMGLGVKTALWENPLWI